MLTGLRLLYLLMSKVVTGKRFHYNLVSLKVEIVLNMRSRVGTNGFCCLLSKTSEKELLKEASILKKSQEMCLLAAQVAHTA